LGLVVANIIDDDGYADCGLGLGDQWGGEEQQAQQDVNGRCTPAPCPPGALDSLGLKASLGWLLAWCPIADQADP
jgi:hypothetical protein